MPGADKQFIGAVRVIGPDGQALQPNAGGGIDATISSTIGTNIGYGQVTLPAGGGQIVAARAGRKGVLIVNHGTTNVFLGDINVGTGTGLLLVGTAGAGIAIDTTAAIYGKPASGSQIVSYMEVF